MSQTSVGAPAVGKQAGSNPLDEAITRSQSFLLSEQKPEGYWVGELLVDVTLVADMLIFYHWWGKVDLEWERKAINHIFDKQLSDGGWNIYPHGPAEVNATIKAYLALKLAGVATHDPRLLKARAMANALGGVDLGRPVRIDVPTAVG